MLDFIQDHGTTLDEHSNKVKCNYCAKVVNSFNRLENHLGGFRGDVVPCEQVPDNVKALVRDGLLERKKQRLAREVGQLEHPNLTLKRNFCPGSSEVNSKKPCPVSAKVDSTKVPTPQKGKKAACSVLENGVEERSMNGKSEDSSRYTLRCIGRFFYDAGIDFGTAKSPYFRQMLDAVANHGTGCRIPSYHELMGWILQEEVDEVHLYVNSVKHSWERTGCSILLDGWTDEQGRSFVSFLVDCPQGVIFLRSIDISDAVDDVNALFLLFDEAIQEVGIENVVQVITYDVSPCMEAVGKRITEKHRTIFWNVCAVRCLGLMLEEIEKMDHVREVINKAKDITRFIYSCSSVLNLMRKHTCGRDLVRSSKIKPAIPFLILESILAEKENLKSMFSSSTWNTSISASRTDGKMIIELIKEPSFWNGAEEALKATVPLLCVLRLIDRAEKPLVGFIYETMDQAKEKIRKNFKDKKAKYLPFWKIIDEIWDNHLHSHLHSAGYFLNPSLFYSSDFLADAEVASGLLYSIVRMVEDRHVHDRIVLQLELYRAAMDAFSLEAAVDHRRKIAPALWWSLYGGHCPELQKLAIRILSQTGSVVSRYDLKRSLSEKLHSKGRNGCIEQSRLHDLELVHCNLQLRHHLRIAAETEDNLVQDEINAVDDWVSQEPEHNLGHDDLGCSDIVNNHVNIEEKPVKEETFNLQVKAEPEGDGLERLYYLNQRVP